MASAPSKLASGAILLVALWIIAYWLTPAPTDEGVKISFGDSPTPERPAESAPEPDPIPLRPPRTEPEPEEAVEEQTPARAEPEQRDALVDVPPEEMGEAAPDDPGADVVPPTFRVYVSQRGDTFQRIAARFYGTTAHWRTIARANPDVDPNRLGPGRRLMIPVDPDNIQGAPAEEGDGAETTEPPPPPEPEYTEYIVQRGDTLSEIAQSLYGRGSLWRRIADANPGVDPDRLRPGTTLRIPPPPAPE